MYRVALRKRRICWGTTTANGRLDQPVAGKSGEFAIVVEAVDKWVTRSVTESYPLIHQPSERKFAH